MPDTLLSRLQRIQNAAARLVLRMPKHCHITGLLYSLHWLPKKERINFKILLMVYKALNNRAPIYIRDMLSLRPMYTIHVRSNDQNYLIVPKSKSVTYGDRNFRHVGPRMWNTLPLEVREADSVDIFKSKLKCILFKGAYDC